LALLLQAWDLYERRELVALVDTALDGDFDAEEACRFLKIGLLCTQDNPKLRPSMSTVVRMLTGQKDLDESKIMKPGLICDFMDLKVRAPFNTKASATTSFNAFSGSEMLDSSILSSENSSTATPTTLTGLYGRSF
jgi:hypothetical protein